MRPQTALERLYEHSAIEIVYAVTDAEGIEVKAKIEGQATQSRVSMPSGHYLIVKVTEKPTIKSGLFAVVSPTESAA